MKDEAAGGDTVSILSVNDSKLILRRSNSATRATRSTRFRPSRSSRQVMRLAPSRKLLRQASNCGRGVRLATALQAVKLSVAVQRTERPFWSHRYYDFKVGSERKVIEKRRYIHRNPVTRGLCGNRMSGCGRVFVIGGRGRLGRWRLSRTGRRLGGVGWGLVGVWRFRDPTSQRRDVGHPAQSFPASAVFAAACSLRPRAFKILAWKLRRTFSVGMYSCLTSSVSGPPSCWIPSRSASSAFVRSSDAFARLPLRASACA